MTRYCEVPGCDKEAYSTGLCHAHYERKRTTGSVGTTPLRIHGDDEKRFWSYVERGECWLWRGTLNRKGYAQWRVKKGQAYVHRWAYERWVGPISEGLQLDHLCRVRNCVNPAHLEPVTPWENTHRSPGLTNATKTHCAQGHAYVPENISMQRGKRVCKECQRQRSRKRKQAARLAKQAKAA